MPRHPMAKKSSAKSQKAGQVKVTGAARQSRCWPRMKPVTCKSDDSTQHLSMVNCISRVDNQSRQRWGCCAASRHLDPRDAVSKGVSRTSQLCHRAVLSLHPNCMAPSCAQNALKGDSKAARPLTARSTRLQGSRPAQLFSLGRAHTCDSGASLAPGSLACASIEGFGRRLLASSGVEAHSSSYWAL